MTPNKYLREQIEVGDSVLSLCCGIGIELKRLPNDVAVTAVDIVPEYLEELQRKFPDFTILQGDVVEYLKHARDKSFDVISCIDGIEHLRKQDGLKLLREAKRVARKKVIIFTPEGHIKNEPKHTWGIDGGDHYQKHLSGWQVKDLTSLGYELVWQNPATSLHGEQYNESMYLCSL